MDRFSLNTAKSFLRKNVNLHLKDGSVIINVQLEEIERDEFKRQAFVTCVAHGNRGKLRLSLRSIAWAEMLNQNLFLTSD